MISIGVCFATHVQTQTTHVAMRKLEKDGMRFQFLRQPQLGHVDFAWNNGQLL